MVINRIWAKILADFLLDMAKAITIANLITPINNPHLLFFDSILLLIKNIVNVIVLLFLVHLLLQIENSYGQN